MLDRNTTPHANRVSRIIDRMEESAVWRSKLPPTTLRRIQARLDGTNVRERCKPAQVFTPRSQAHVLSANRRSLKATFYDADVVRWVHSALPARYELLPTEHIDLIQYNTGDFFKEHTDFVYQYPQHGEQVTVIVGLEDAEAGGTQIRESVSSPERKIYTESITKGGVLVFPSHYLHSGEPVRGRKEIMVFKGFCFYTRVSKEHLASPYTDTMQVIAVYSMYQRMLSSHEDDEDAYREDKKPTPELYLYLNQQLIAYVDVLLDEASRYTTPTRVTHMEQEQLRLLRVATNTEPPSTVSYPWLNEWVEKKGVLSCFENAINRKSVSTTRYAYNTEFCNDGDDYEVREAVGISHRYTKHFHITIYNKAYYSEVLNRVSHIPLPIDVVDCVYTFLEM